MYSAGLGELAAEGARRNSPFAAAFLKCLGKGGDIAATLKAAAAEDPAGDGRGSVALSLFEFDPRLGLQSQGARAGILYLDGKKIGDVTPRAEARLGGVETGNRCLEPHYPDGQSERQIAAVPGARTTSMAFGYRPVQPKPSPPPNFVHVPGGSFTMGSPPAEAGRYSNEVQHRVSLTGFEMDKYDVTFEEYDAYCAATGMEKPSDNGWGRGTRPVVNVDWHDAVAYCNWRSRQEGRNPAYAINVRRVDCDWGANGYRLPTEAEWSTRPRADRPRRATSRTPCTPGSSDLNAMTWNSANSKAQTHPVGRKRRTASVCTTCRGTSGNGAGTGTSPTREPIRATPRAPSRASSGSCAGVAGTSTQGPSVRANRGYNGPSSHDSVCGLTFSAAIEASWHFLDLLIFPSLGLRGASRAAARASPPLPSARVGLWALVARV